jgi:hypothetical protein
VGLRLYGSSAYIFYPEKETGGFSETFVSIYQTRTSTSKKTVILKLAAVRTSYLTQSKLQPQKSKPKKNGMAPEQEEYSRHFFISNSMQRNSLIWYA